MSVRSDPHFGQRVTLGTPTSTSDWSLGDKKPQHPGWAHSGVQTRYAGCPHGRSLGLKDVSPPGWAHTTVSPRPGPRAPGRAPPPVARLPGLPGCPLRELELGNTTNPLPSTTPVQFSPLHGTPRYVRSTYPGGGTYRGVLRATAEFIRSVYDSRWIRGHKRNAKA